MAARSDGTQLDWVEIDTDNLSKKLAALFKTYRTAQDAANVARTNFDEELEKGLRAGEHVPEAMFCVIAHKWGKVSYAISEDERAKRGGKKTNRLVV